MSAHDNLPEAIALPGSAAAVVAWRAQGQLQLTVIAKATFAFARDTEMPLGDPQEILRAEVHHGNNPGRSIRFTNDLAPYLGRVDVMFTGAACSTPGQPVQSMAVRLAVFTPERTALDKTLEVRDRNGFERIPIVYERAIGGINNQENPVGSSDPNVVDPAAPQRPAGFGPISRTWPARKRLLGETPRRVLDGPIAEIPAGFDWSYFQAAPLDQRVEALRGDEWILLDGLHPTAPRLQMRLPGARGRARIHGLAAFGVPEGQLLDLRLDTLRIDGDEGRCTVVWRQSVPVPDEAAIAAARIVAGVELPGAPIAWPETLPERRAAAARSAIPEMAASSVQISSVDVEPAGAPVMSTLMTGDEGAARSKPLPFLPSNLAAPAIAQAPSEPHEHIASGTLALPGDDTDAARAPVVPFVGSAERTTSAPFVAAPMAAPAAPIVAPTAPAASWGAAPGAAASALPASPWSGAAPSTASAAAVPARPGTIGQQAAALPVAPALVAAVPLSALEASNAAAEPQKAAGESAAAAEWVDDGSSAPGAVLDLLWFDAKLPPRARKHAAWRDLLDGLEDKPHDPDIDTPGLADGEDRRAIFEILTHGAPLGPAALRAALKRAIRSDGRFVAPLVLVAGEIAFPFDELETLRALAAAAAPFASGDPGLQGAIEGAREIVKTPDLALIAEVVEGATARLREAYGKGKRALPLAEIEAQADRALLKQRRYQRRDLFGGTQIRALLRLPEASDAIPTYLPAALADALPMYQRFEARIVAEGHLAADQHEAHPVALRAVAIARSSTPAHDF
ncbi:MAG: DUF2169 domain-containing protein [Minicystis sp.]